MLKSNAVKSSPVTVTRGASPAPLSEVQAIVQGAARIAEKYAQFMRDGSHVDSEGSTSHNVAADILTRCAAGDWRALSWFGYGHSMHLARATVETRIAALREIYRVSRADLQSPITGGVNAAEMAFLSSQRAARHQATRAIVWGLCVGMYEPKARQVISAFDALSGGAK